ncbi:hypothetical protein [Prosthecobacter fusiformis]|uniref:hypothetical protein n=1 Tax=Prosthecobacter fusiformis TaxID=48464 RepID=UPI00105D74E8|nr:hypothetical protein [Prosthecobacter fusiformis]
MVKAVQRYETLRGHYPKEEADLITFMSSTPASREGILGGWHYVKDGMGFRLNLSLGWDPSLIYVGSKSSAHWAFDPGDGTPEKVIILTP